MGRKPTGKVMEDTVWVPQKNGTWYCYSRRRVWEDGKTKNLGKTLLGKADERGGELRPTRPRRRPEAAAEAGAQDGRAVEATRLHTGATDILELVGRESGVDEDVRAACRDAGVADKVISLARYLVATGGGTWPGVEPWMLTHPVPYRHPITEDVYLELFKALGLDESIAEGLFARRIARETDPVLLVAYDSSTETSESRNPEAREGMNKDRPGKPAVKLLVLYSLGTRMPIAYAKRPGNVPDVVAVDNAIAQLQALTDKRIAFVTDGGFASDASLGAILHSRSRVLTRVKVGWAWVRKEADACADRLRLASTTMHCDLGTHGATTTLTREFSYARLRGSRKKGLAAGDTDHFRRRVYLHVYHSSERRERENQDLLRQALDVKALVERGTPLDAQAEALRDSLLDVRRRGKRVTVELRDDAIDEACRYHGTFALLSDFIKDPCEALETYRRREWIEDYFERFKQDADGKAARTGSAEGLAGRLLVQFVAMCYLEHLHNRVREMKATLGVPNGDPEHDRKGNLDAEGRLKAWLEKRSLHGVLAWFDAHETFEVSSEIRRRKWGTEVVKRDNMFLERLGVRPTA